MDLPGLEASGFAIIPDVLTTQQCDSLLEAVLPFAPAGRKGGTRNLLQLSPAVRDFALSGELRSMVRPALGSEPIPVQALLFDKHPTANWKVPWHQDLTVPVRARIDVPGFGPWSTKAGTPHVQPPADLLERLLAVRVHLDDCLESQGPLLVLPGSHRAGILGPEQVAACRASRPPVVCTVRRGGLLILRPLLLHASSCAQVPSRRRVLHIVFASGSLPEGLEWQERPESLGAA